MRIRKNTELSSLLSGYGGEIPETYVCHFNQSPWDVIPLISSSGNSDCASDLTNSSSFIPSPPLLYHCGEEDSYNENASLGDSNGAAERLHHIAVTDNYERTPDSEELMDLSDNSDKKSNSPAETSGGDEKVTVTMRGPPKRGRPRGTAKKAQATTNNPNEFYYYSGFGPRRGRKRGCEDNMRSSNSSEEEEENDDQTGTFRDRYSNFDEMEYELVDNNQDSKESEELNEKKMKRCREPIKERSLKSLM